MRFRPLAASLAGAAFFAALPVYAPPVVLQADELNRAMAGVVAAAAAGAVLSLGARRPAAGVALVLACALAGALLYSYAYAIPTYGPAGAEAAVAVLVLPIFAFAYMGVPAGVGAGLAALARGLVDRLGGNRDRRETRR